MATSLPRILIAGCLNKTSNYEMALKNTGLKPITALNNGNNYRINLNEISSFNGLLLPGGGDIEPSLFNETNNGSRNIDKTIDIKQLELLDIFVKEKKPVLGICKGLQIINIYFGGNIIQDLPYAKAHAWDNVDKIHSNTSVKRTFIDKLYGYQFVTNSAHHQGVNKLGKDIKVAQYAYDNVIEAIYHETLPIIAVQWHPERMCYLNSRNDTVNGAKIFNYYYELIKLTL